MRRGTTAELARTYFHIHGAVIMATAVRLFTPLLPLQVYQKFALTGFCS